MMIRKIHPHQTELEELFNALSHALGIILGIMAIVLLSVYATFTGSALKIVSCIIYGITLTIMYTASTLYHGSRYPHLKQGLKIFDHASIYLLIAGSYTPFALGSIGGAWGWSLFAIIWAMAIAGVIFKLFFAGRFERLSVAIYLVMGWLIVVAIKPLIEHVPLGGMVFLASGGLAYTAGIIFYAFDKKYHFFHFIWHLFVLAGSLLQFFGVMFYVV